MDQNHLDHEVAIIGTGFSGLGAAIALDRVGIGDLVLLEKSDDIGGTWRDNKYPGACCDVPSQLYSFSYELNPNWSQRFTPAKEIHAYQQHVVRKYGLLGRIRMGFEVANAGYGEGIWTLNSRNGEQLRVRYLISAIGALHIPNKPAFPGLEDYRGKIMHSAEWDNAYELADKRVIVIGSAASAIQIIPQVAKIATHVSVLQRTASYFLPRKDRTHLRIEKLLFRTFPFIQRLYRWRQYCFNDLLFHPNFLNRPSLRKKLVHYMVSRHIRAQVSDPGLIKQLTPDYEIGCKRLLLSDDLMPALQRSNVSLLSDQVSHFTKGGLVTKNGTEIAADLVVLATGFQSTRLFGDMKIVGPENLSINKAWAETIRAYRSVAIKGFPNFFMMYGPNSNLGHSSIIIMIEAQASHIARILTTAERKEKPIVEVRPGAETAYNESIQKALGNTVWSSNCQSWYKNKDGQIFSLWPHSTTRFIREMRKAPIEDYRFYSPDQKTAMSPLLGH